MALYTFWGRTIDYTTSGMPRVAEMPASLCADLGQERHFGRHVRYAPNGIYTMAVPLTCCRTVSNDRFEHGCWPLGIGQYVGLYVGNVQNCRSAEGQFVVLEYSGTGPGCGGEGGSGGCGGGHGSWTGSISLRGGGLTFCFTCQEPTIVPPDGIIGNFCLSWTGCSTGMSVQQTGNCLEPIALDFGQWPMVSCCDCPLEHTSEGADVHFHVEFNCRPIVRGRHVGYSGLTPLVVTDHPCVRGPVPTNGCAGMTCGLVATIQGVGDCVCMSLSDPPIDMNYLAGVWRGEAALCMNNLTLELSCTDVCGSGSGYSDDEEDVLRCTDDGRGVRLSLTAVCGVDHIGGAPPIEIPALDMENLDVTFEVTMAGPTVDCGTPCSFTWIDMLPGWLQNSNCGNPDCNCDAPDFDGTEGQTVFMPCSGADEAACCDGKFFVRIMRQ